MYTWHKDKHAMATDCRLVVVTHIYTEQLIVWHTRIHETSSISQVSGGVPFDFPPGKYTLAVSDPANNIRGMTFISVLRWCRFSSPLCSHTWSTWQPICWACSPSSCMYVCMLVCVCVCVCVLLWLLIVLNQCKSFKASISIRLRNIWNRNCTALLLDIYSRI